MTGSLSQPNFFLIAMNRTTPVIRFHGLPLVLRNSGSPEPFGAVFISLRVNAATSGRTGLLRRDPTQTPYRKRFPAEGGSSLAEARSYTSIEGSA